MTIKKYGRRFFAVYDERDELVCVTVYKKGAREVVRRLAAAPSPSTVARSIGGRTTPR